jgi:iron complex outermembrane receptor protein
MKVSSINSAALALAISVALGHAQAAEADLAQGEAAGAATGTVEEIIVTAQKRSQHLEDVPISITVVSGEALEQAGVTSFSDLTSISVGTNIARTGAYTQPAIRGISTTVVSVGQENNVATYIDGFYEPNPIILTSDLTNIAQVQILKGPQGTLFGRNATGGAILVSTVDPSSRAEGKAVVSYGNYNDRRAELYLNMPVTATLAANIDAYYRASDGYVKDIDGFDTLPLDYRNVRAKVAYQPTDSIKALLVYNHAEISDATGLAVTQYAHQLALANNPNAIVESGTNRTSVNFQPHSEARNDSFGLMLDFDFGSASLKSFTRYLDGTDGLHYDADGSKSVLFDVTLSQRERLLEQEFDLSGNFGSTEWVIGAFAFRNEQNQDYLRFYNPAAGVYGFTGAGMTTTAYAGFADATFHATERLSFTGGVRYSSETKDFYFEAPQYTRVVDTDGSWSGATPRAVVQYQLGERSNVYASYSKGFKSGTFNTTTADPTPVKPEEVSAYEVGYKMATRDLSLNLATFYYDYRDLQVSVVSVLPNGRVNTRLANAANAEIYGAEVEGSYAFSANGSLRAGVAYTHARYREFTDAPGNLLNVSPGVGANVGGLNVNAPQDWSGTRMIRAPDLTFNLGADYSIPLRNSGAIELGGNLYVTSEYSPSTGTINQTVNNGVITDLGGQRYQQDGYVLVNAQVGYVAPGKRWRVTFYGKNLTNENYALVRQPNTYGDYEQYAPPMTYGLRGEVRF